MLKWLCRVAVAAVISLLLQAYSASLGLADENCADAEPPDFKRESELLMASGCHSQYLDARFEEFAKDYPDTLEFVGEERVRLFIGMSLAKGLYYNLDAEREVNTLCIMMLYLGSGFDSDPLYPWARFPVFSPKENHEDENPESWVYMLEVWERFLVFYRRSVGYFEPSEDYTFRSAIRALRRVEELRFDDIARIYNGDAAVNKLKEIYPERFAQMPEAALRGPVLQLAAQKAEEYGMPSPAGRNLFLGIFFYCGSSATENPLYKPLFEGLKEMQPNGLNKERELFKRFMRFLKFSSS